MASDLKLCYVKGPWAYFTSIEVTKQWGDDWDDAPYEHNAGEPYDDHVDPEKRNHVPHEVMKVAWEGPYETPADRAGSNSPWSVQAINRGDIAWLIPSRWEKTSAEPIHAGTLLGDFIRKVREAGGVVYLPYGEDT